MSASPPLHVFIAEDEAPARERLRRLLDRVGNIEVVGEARDGQQALALLQDVQPDVLLLDINMPGLDGLRLAEALDDPPAIIFTTAYEHHAVKAFELDAVDYLLKPFSAERLARALDRVRRTLAAHATATGAAPPRIAVEEGRARHFIEADAIAAARMDEGVVFVFSRQGERLIYAGTLQQLVDQLAGAPHFLQASRQSLVNVRAVRSAESTGDGRLILTLDGGTTEEVSRRRARFFRAALGQ